jgi:hypothetical protein
MVVAQGFREGWGCRRPGLGVGWPHRSIWLSRAQTLQWPNPQIFLEKLELRFLFQFVNVD